MKKNMQKHLRAQILSLGIQQKHYCDDGCYLPSENCPKNLRLNEKIEEPKKKISGSSFNRVQVPNNE